MIESDFVGLVPARSGSKSVIDKNLQNVDGVSLIGRAVDAGLSSYIRNVYISTDKDSYGNEAEKYGGKFEFLRPKSISHDEAIDNDYLKHFVEWCDDQGKAYKFVVLLRPTTPFRNAEILNDAMKVMVKFGDEVTSLRSGHLCSESPFKWFMRDDKGFFKPLDGIMSPDDVNMPRQSFENVYVPNGYIDIMRFENIRNNIFWGNRMYVFETPVSYEVDSPEDLELCRLMASKIDGE